MVTCPQSGGHEKFLTLCHCPGPPAGKISSRIAKDQLPSLLEGAANAKGVRALVEELGVTMVTDEKEIEAMVQKVRVSRRVLILQYA